MANKERVLSALSNAELCDDCLSVASGVKPRQTVYTICKELSASEIIFRHHGKCEHCHKAKLVNRIADKQLQGVESKTSYPPTNGQPIGAYPWFWEGNVQSKVVSYLASKGYVIRSVADTGTRTQGKDIIAVAPDGRELWVSVKGYPEKSSNVQARHWFSGAVFDLLLYRGEDPNAKLAIAIPDGFVTYTNLLPRIDWLKQSMQFQVFFVSENGNVRVE